MSAITLTKDNFDEVLAGELPVLVDFWAEWCGPCKMYSPVIEAFAEENEDKVVLGKVNVDEQPELAGRFKVMSIPTTILFREGEEYGKLVGLQPAEMLEELLEN